MIGTAIPRGLLPESAGVVGGHLTIAGRRVVDLVAEFGSPLFIYDEQQLIDRCREAVEAFGEGRLCVQGIPLHSHGTCCV